MLLQAIISVSLETLKDFYVGSLHLVIALWVSNGRMADFYAKIFVVPLECNAVNLDPLSVMILFRTPNLQMLNLINLTVDGLSILTTWVPSDHLVNLLTVT
jgi:hypothetical protein